MRQVDPGLLLIDEERPRPARQGPFVLRMLPRSPGVSVPEQSELAGILGLGLFLLLAAIGSSSLVFLLPQQLPGQSGWMINMLTATTMVSLVAVPMAFVIVIPVFRKTSVLLGIVVAGEVAFPTFVVITIMIAATIGLAFTLLWGVLMFFVFAVVLANVLAATVRMQLLPYTVEADSGRPLRILDLVELMVVAAVVYAVFRALGVTLADMVLPWLLALAVIGQVTLMLRAYLGPQKASWKQHLACMIAAALVGCLQLVPITLTPWPSDRALIGFFSYAALLSWVAGLVGVAWLKGCGWRRV